MGHSEKISNMRLKKLFLLFLILVFVHGCATTQSLISDGKLYTGMSKESLRNLLVDVYPSEDAFIPGSFSEQNLSKKKEIISGSGKKLFYVFKNVNKPVDCGLILCKYGDGSLVSWHYTLSAARAALVTDKNTTNQEQPQIMSKSSDKNKDHIDALNQLIEDLESGKISESEFNQKKAQILK